MSIIIGIGKNLKVTPTPTPPSVDPDITTYIEGLTTELSLDQIARLDTFAKCLKAGLGITYFNEFFDIMYIFAGETQESSLRNLVARTFDCTLVNAPAFAQYEGFTGNGANAYIRTNFVPSTDGTNYTLNDAAHGAYIRTNVQEGRLDYGVGSGGAFFITLLSRHTTNIFQMRINDGTDTPQIANSDSRGMFIEVRTSNTNRVKYKNLTSYGNENQASVGVPALELIALGYNNGGAPALLCTRQISFLFVSKSFDATKQAFIVNCFETYMDANGKGVIT